MRRKLAQLARSPIGGAALRVACVLLARTAFSAIVVTTLPELAREVGCKRMALWRALDELERAGVVVFRRVRTGEALSDGRTAERLALEADFGGENVAKNDTSDGEDSSENVSQTETNSDQNVSENETFSRADGEKNVSETETFSLKNVSETETFSEAHLSGDLLRSHTPPTPSQSRRAAAPPEPPGAERPPGGDPPERGGSPSGSAPKAPVNTGDTPEPPEKAAASAAPADARRASAPVSAVDTRTKLVRTASHATGKRAVTIEHARDRRASLPRARGVAKARGHQVRNPVAALVVSDAARELVANWTKAIGYEVASLPAEWLQLAQARLEDVGATICERALSALKTSEWHNASTRRAWARLPNYALRSADNVIALAEAAPVERRRPAATAAAHRPTLVQPHASQVAAAATLLDALERPRNHTEKKR